MNGKDFTHQTTAEGRFNFLTSPITPADCTTKKPKLALSYSANYFSEKVNIILFFSPFLNKHWKLHLLCKDLKKKKNTALISNPFIQNDTSN